MFPILAVIYKLHLHLASPALSLSFKECAQNSFIISQWLLKLFELLNSNYTHFQDAEESAQ